MDYAIETNGLSKFYGDVRAVKSVDLRVGISEAYGFWVSMARARPQPFARC